MSENFSAGGPGTSIRSDERLYHNATEYYSDPAQLETMFSGLLAYGEQISQPISRTVFRGIVSNRVMHSVRRNGLAETLEVAMPLEEFGHPGDWLIYLGHNAPGREPLVSKGLMVAAIADPPAASPERPLPPGFRLARSLPRTDEPQLLELWGPTFGQTGNTVAGTAAAVRQQLELPADGRNLWLSLCYHGSRIASAAMAETVELATSDPLRPLVMVESTEWRTRDGYQGHGLMEQTVRYLHGQVLESFANRAFPLLYAETNYTSGANRVGNRAGMVSPSGHYAGQVILQNVRVDEGRPGLAAGLRDFVFQFVPRPEGATQ
jgi:hypothetical protein